MNFDASQVFNTLIQTVAGGLFLLATYLMRDLHMEFKALKADHQNTKDRVLTLEIKADEE
jgi:hypothetical protein